MTAEGQQHGLPLADQIRSQIRTQGPMSLSTYMRLCLTHPNAGYYRNADPLGAGGDFITAPEVSQMFGEMVGAWVLMHWHVIGKPPAFDLVELGPGRGTLMADAVRMISSDPEALAAMRIVLLETSDMLIRMQREKLAEHGPEWITEIADLEDRGRPLIIVANEFFDALPIKQFQFDKGRWHERMIGLDGDELVWGLSETPLPADLVPAAISHPSDGEIFEFSPLAQSTAAEISALLNKRGGGMIAFDYGYTRTQTGDTFQAVARHAFADPFTHPGAADLTAHVDFEALINAARETGAHAHIAGTQAEVLEELGIRQRTEKLQQANPERADQFAADLDRLIGKDQMGNLFKVMVMFGAGAAAPFETDGDIAALPGVRHGFFGRQGGISGGVLASLNVSFNVGDEPDNVVANRATVMQSLSLEPDRLATVKQVHSADVVTIDDTYDPENPPEADGMVTNRTGVALGVLTADCTPILFVDATAGIIGACHAGWRGAVDGVIEKTVAAMTRLGADPAGILAAIGPVIFADDYEVGPEFARDVIARHPDAARHFAKPAPDAKEHFDLPGFVADRLRAAGIGRFNQIGQSTYARPDLYFSHRYATHHDIGAGRQISVIALT